MIRPMTENPVPARAGHAVAAVIFDCDGTLVDSEPLNARGVAHMFATDHGLTLDPADIEHEFRGGRFETMIETLAARHGVQVAEDFTARYRTHMYARFARELEPMPSVREAIEAIKATGLPICVASSGPEKKMAVALESTDLARYFGERVFSAYTIGIWKPEPDLFLNAAAALDVEPERCAVIEDSNAGVEAARRAGMRVFGYDPLGAIGDHPGAHLTRFIDFSVLPDLIAAG